MLLADIKCGMPHAQAWNHVISVTWGGAIDITVRTIFLRPSVQVFIGCVEHVYTITFNVLTLVLCNTEAPPLLLHELRTRVYCCFTHVFHCHVVNNSLSPDLKKHTVY